MGYRLLLALALLGGASVARAQERPVSSETTVEPGEGDRAASRAAFRKGVAALEKQQWQEAREAFTEAYKLFPHPSILLDLGIARAHVGEVVEAEQDLTRFLAEDTTATADELQTARTTLADVRSRVATLRLRVAPAAATATLDGKPVALVTGAFLDVRVTRGRHTLLANAPAHEAWNGTIELDSPEKVIDITLAIHEVFPLHPGLGTARIAAIVCGSVAVVTAGVASFAGVESIDLANQYNTVGQANYQNPSTKSTGIAFRTTADVLFVVTGALVALGVVLWVTAPRHPARVGVTPLGVLARF